MVRKKPLSSRRSQTLMSCVRSAERKRARRRGPEVSVCVFREGIYRQLTCVFLWLPR